MSLGDELERLQALTERLRRDCPWDREQTARTIVPHTVEEAYEVADAAISGSPEKLLDELGDLLFQVYFLSLLLQEQGQGDLAEVARTVHDKLVRRHPHVFGETDAATAGRVKENWERIKTEQEGREGVFHDVPEALPALLHARKVQRRAATVGYEWVDVAGPLEKLEEELAELRAELDRAGVRATASPKTCGCRRTSFSWTPRATASRSPSPCSSSRSERKNTWNRRSPSSSRSFAGSPARAASATSYASSTVCGTIVRSVCSRSQGHSRRRCRVRSWRSRSASARLIGRIYCVSVGASGTAGGSYPAA